jgi:hypothetical protein
MKMPNNFDELLQLGSKAADDVLRNEKEVNKVIENLKTSLCKFLQFDVTLDEEVDYVKYSNHLPAISELLRPKEATGFKVVVIRHKSGANRELFKLKRSDDIYPVTVAIEKHSVIADTQQEFRNAVGQAISNSQLHLKLKAFKREVDEIVEKNVTDSTGS